MVRQYRHCITFNPRGSLDAWRNQLLRVLVPRDVAQVQPAPTPVPPPSSPCSSPTTSQPVLAEGPLLEGTLQTSSEQCKVQCADCSCLRVEIARLQLAEQLGLERIRVLEAENQQLRSTARLVEGLSKHPEEAAEIGSEPMATALDGGDRALTPEPIAPAPLPTPAAPVAQDLKVVVHSLPCSGAATPAVLLSTFTRFCRDQLRMVVVPVMRAVKVFCSRPGTVAGLLELRSQQDVEALFWAKRQHLGASSPVSINRNRPLAERRRRSAARRAGTRLVAAGVETRIDACGQTRRTSNLRADAPVFVAATHAQALPDSIEQPGNHLHQE